MKILLAATGSLGDLYPLMAVGAALKARGCAVTVATGQSYRPTVEAAGFVFTPLAPDLAAFAVQRGHDAPSLTREGQPDFVLLLRAVMAQSFEESLDQLMEAAKGADLIAAAPNVLAAWTAAHLSGKPLVTLAVSPAALPTAYDPPVSRAGPFTPKPLTPFGVARNRRVLGLNRSAMEPAYQALRKVEARRSLPAAPMDPAGVFSDRLSVGLFSPLLMRARPDHPRGLVIAGATPFDTGQGLDPELADWLAAGSPPIIFTLGSTLGVEGAYAAAASAARALGRRALLLGSGMESAGGEVRAAAFAPMDLVLPHAAAIVHHGGAGTVQAAMLGGTPQIALPMIADQFDNAERARRLGIAKVMSLDQWISEGAYRALQGLLSDSRLSARARAVRNKVKREDGAAEAADLILAAGRRLP